MKRKLIFENAQETQALRFKAETNARTLNEARQYASFETFEELQKLVREIPSHNEAEMRKNKLVSQMLDLHRQGQLKEAPAPGPELVARAKALTYGLDAWELVSFSADCFVVNEEELEVRADKFRRYISEPYQFERLEFMEKLAEVLNSFQIGPYSRQRNFAPNEFVTFENREGNWKPNLASLFSDINQFKH